MTTVSAPNILLVDDEKLVVAALRLTVEASGFIAADCCEAFSVLAGQPPPSSFQI
jgi:hypothetical protein